MLVQADQGPYTGVWNLSGGEIKFGETSEAALQRELEEKTGLRATPDPVLVGSSSQSGLHPDLSDAEIHLLAFLFRPKLDSTPDVKTSQDGRGSLVAYCVHQRDLEGLNIGRFAQQGIDR